MQHRLKCFRVCEDCAVSAEFVVVTSAAVALCVATLATRSDGYLDTTMKVNNAMKTTVAATCSTRSD